METTPRRRDPVLLTIVGVVILLVIIALIAVFTRGESAELDPESPEGVVQQLTTAMIAADYTRARDFVADSALEDCEPHGGFTPDRDTRVTLRDTVVGDTYATVRVGMISGSGGNVFGDTYEEEGEFTLMRSDGEWLVTAAPWRFDLCIMRGLQ